MDSTAGGAFAFIIILIAIIVFIYVGLVLGPFYQPSIAPFI